MNIREHLDMFVGVCAIILNACGSKGVTSYQRCQEEDRFPAAISKGIFVYVGMFFLLGVWALPLQDSPWIAFIFRDLLWYSL